MQTLPIKYFDSHPHGETMSTYTNDVDTLRQMISQSIPQVFSCAISMIAILFAMFATDIYMTLFVLVMVAIMVLVSKFFAKRSSKNFIAQQKNLSIVDGYIEEMMAGQKVVKVFCYEEENKKKFDKLNEALCDSMTKANSYANTLMPCIMNIGNLGYVLVAVIGRSSNNKWNINNRWNSSIFTIYKSIYKPTRASITTNELNNYGTSWS